MTSGDPFQNYFSLILLEVEKESICLKAVGKTSVVIGLLWKRGRVRKQLHFWVSLYFHITAQFTTNRPALETSRNMWLRIIEHHEFLQELQNHLCCKKRKKLCWPTVKTLTVQQSLKFLIFHLWWGILGALYNKVLYTKNLIHGIKALVVFCFTHFPRFNSLFKNEKYPYCKGVKLLYWSYLLK